MVTRRGLAGLVAAGSFMRTARAQDAGEGGWPDRPLRIVVPYAPGGTNDIAARLLAQHLTEALAQPAVVENRPGAQAIVGTELVARSRPDGYTLLVGASGPIVFNAVTYDRLSYDPLNDLVPVSQLVSFPLMLLVAADSPHRTVADLVRFAKAHPERSNYGSPAASFQLAAELFNLRAGTRFTYVAYRGSAEVATALFAGDITMALLDTAPVVGALAAGRLRALAVTSDQRLPSHPEVPTMAEAGYPDVRVVLWTGLFAPGGTPASIVNRLHGEVVRLVQAPAYRQRIEALVSRPISSTPTAFRATIAREIALWRDVARSAGIRFER